MKTLRLFVYGNLLTGHRDHSALDGATLLGEVLTAPQYTLVDIDVYAALIIDGKTAVCGELYSLDYAHLARIDALRQVPHLFQRQSVALADTTLAECYFMSFEQVRGRRRLGHGNWRERFAPRSVPHRERALSKWARKR
jgi:gamma-glutamylcyclotransferase (GGCT)/AIG2-like uncharacterized protein YtfP